MLVRLIWLAASTSMCLLAWTSSVNSTRTCVDSVSQRLFSISCDPQYINIQAVITGRGTCVGYYKSQCTDTAGSWAYVRQLCHDRLSCLFTVSDAARPQCEAWSNSFYLTIVHSCSEPGSSTKKTSNTPTTSKRTTTSTTTLTSTPVSPSQTNTTAKPEPSPSVSVDTTGSDEVTMTEPPTISPEEQIETNNKRQTSKVLVIALPVMLLIIVIVVIIVLICVLRKRNKNHGMDSQRKSSAAKDKADNNCPSSSTHDHDQLKLGQDEINTGYSVVQGIDENEQSSYCTAHSQECADMARVKQPDQISDIYDEVRHEDTADVCDVVQTGEHSTSDKTRPNILGVNTEEQAEADITDIYSLVNKVRRDPDELELHDNPMYGGCLNKL